jgi:glycosyltransferase involved in cell wall biosynthesis
MRILFVTPMVPSVAGGAPTRTFNLLRELSIEHEISVLTIVQPSEFCWISALESYCERVDVVPYKGFTPSGKWSNRLRGWWRLFVDSRPEYARTYPIERMRKPLQSLVDALHPDVVHFAHLFTAELLPYVGSLPAVLDEHNVEFEIAKGRQTLARNPIHVFRDCLAWRKLLRFETHWTRRFPVCLAVSDRDADILKRIAGAAEIHVVPNGVDTAFFAPPNAMVPKPGPSIVFAGTMHYQPNVDGILFFCHQIWPFIRQALPGVKLTIVGAKPVPEVVALQSLSGVSVTGFVEDIRPYFWQATASVVPLRVGGGTRLKVLESLAAGCPVVSTTIGAEGLHLEPGADILLADDPEGFAAHTIRLLIDRRLGEQLAFRGQQTVRRLYDWKSIVRRVEPAYQRSLEIHRCHSSA